VLANHYNSHGLKMLPSVLANSFLYYIVSINCQFWPYW